MAMVKLRGGAAWGPAFPETLTFVPPRIWGGEREGNI
jgi:hypothetical protein